MIHVVEGPNAAGKSAFAAHLSRRLGIPLYVDAGRKFYQSLGMTGGDLQERAAPFDLLVVQIAPSHDFVLDRYWPTNYVFKRLNPDRPPLPGYLEGSPAERALRFAGVEAHYYVRAPVDVISGRLATRGESPDLAAAELREYDRLYRELEDAGVPFVSVDGTRGLGRIR